MRPTTRLALLGAAAAGLVRRRRTLAAVAPELRTPRLWLPLWVDSRPLLAVARRLFLGPTAPVPGVRLTTAQVPGGQDVLVLTPEGTAQPRAAVLWVHGGGYVLGRPEADLLRCSRLARDLGVVVVAPRYRLAPEHPFPAALDDCTAALRWLHASAPELGVDSARVAVAGASAGGGLAATVVQRAVDEGLAVAFQGLVYPMLDDRTVVRGDHLGRGRLVWTPRSNAFGWTSYLGTAPGSPALPRYAVAARREDLAGLPPAWIGVGELDLFHDEDVAYARRLEQAGVPVVLHLAPGMYHAAEVDLPEAPSMRAFEQSLRDALGAALG